MNRGNILGIIVLFFYLSGVFSSDKTDENTLVKLEDVAVNDFGDSKIEIMLKFNDAFSVSTTVVGKLLKFVFPNVVKGVDQVNNNYKTNLISFMSLSEHKDHLEFVIQVNDNGDIKVNYDYADDNKYVVVVEKDIPQIVDRAVILQTSLDISFPSCFVECKKKNMFPYMLLTYNGDYFPSKTRTSVSSKKFKKALQLVLNHEGGFVDDPDDPGGKTKYGISSKSYPDLDIAQLTLDEAKWIYKRDYWDPFDYDAIEEESIACKVFDLTVNVGHQVCHRFIYKALCSLGYDVVESEELDQNFFSLINEIEAQTFIASLNKQASNYYHEIVEKNPSQRKFLKGWLNRVNSFL
jgi:hypothetical protein